MWDDISKYMSLLKTHRYIAIAGIATAFYTFGNGLVFFLLPILIGSMTKNFALLGFLIAIPSAVSMFFDIPTGGLSDHVGRKKIVIMGLCGMILFAFLLPTAGSIQLLAIFLLVLGFSNQLINVPIRAYIMDISPKDKTSEYFGVQTTGMQIGFALAPIVAGFLLSKGLVNGTSMISLLYTLACLIPIFIIFFGFNEKAKSKGSVLSGIKSLIRTDKIFMREIFEYTNLKSVGLVIFLLTLMFIIADGLIWAIEPLYYNLGIDTENVGILLSMFVIPFILFQIPAGFLADKIGKIKILLLGLLLAGSFLILFGLTKDIYVMIITAFISTLGLALAIPATDGLLTDVSSGKMRGGIVGVWDVAEDLGYIIGPIVGGIIAEFYKDITIPFIFLGASILLLVIPVLHINNKNKLSLV